MSYPESPNRREFQRGKTALHSEAYLAERVDRWNGTQHGGC